MNEKNVIRGVQVSFWTPIIITFICVLLEVTRLFVVGAEFVFPDDFVDLLKMLISYFFPTFMASAITALIAHYGSDEGCSGIRPESGLQLLFSTLVYGAFYLVYWMLYDKPIVVIAYTVLCILYAWFVLKRCVDKRFSLWNKIPKVNDVAVRNTPNGKER